MTNIKLSKRLQAIADMVDDGSITIDIGCDHALLDIYLLKNKIVKKAYASDITEGALNQAKTNVKHYDEKNLVLRLADGLDAIKSKDNINTIIISGLGNQSIINILSNKDKLSKINNLIIQSNTGYYDLRKKICSLDYYIESEKIIKEKGIKYIIIKFNRGNKKYSFKQLYLGPVLLLNKDVLFKELVSEQINKNNNILRSLPNRYVVRKLKLIKLNSMLKKEIHY